MHHIIYSVALKMSDADTVEQAKKMEAQFGEEWWYTTAHPQTIRDYVTAKDDSGRLTAMRTMIRDGLAYAMNVRSAFYKADM